MGGERTFAASPISGRDVVILDCRRATLTGLNGASNGATSFRINAFYASMNFDAFMRFRPSPNR